MSIRLIFAGSGAFGAPPAPPLGFISATTVSGTYGAWTETDTATAASPSLSNRAETPLAQ